MSLYESLKNELNESVECKKWNIKLLVLISELEKQIAIKDERIEQLLKDQKKYRDKDEFNYYEIWQLYKKDNQAGGK